MRFDTEHHCHCGAAYGRSDHCPECSCEQYETINVRDCGHTAETPFDRLVKLYASADSPANLPTIRII